MTLKDAQLVSNLSCQNAEKTFDKMLFSLYGIRCHDNYDRNKYIENLLYIDLIKSEHDCSEQCKCK